MTTREQVVRDTIHFRGAERLPVLNLNRDQHEGDILMYSLALQDGARNEWGYLLEHAREDGTIGHPGAPLLPTWEDVERHPDPTWRREERTAGLPAFLREAGDAYRLASLGISGFNVYMFLRGFEQSITDYRIYPEEAARLADRIARFEIRQLELAAEMGMHGIHFADDWGTQLGLMIPPEDWRAFFKERYRAQFHRAHELGLDVWFHCCGNLFDIIGDLRDVGVDVMNISQPNVVDIEEVGRRWRGQFCFMVPISYQTVSISGTPEAICAEAARLHRHLAAPSGGFIGYVEEYTCMGMSETNYQACRRAFRELETLGSKAGGAA